MHHKIKIAAIAILLALLPSLASAALYTLTASLDGDQPAEPANRGSSATGLLEMVIDSDTLLFDFDLTVDGIDVSELRAFGPNSTSVHIHNGPVGVFGPPIIDAAFLLGSSYQTLTGGFRLSGNGLSLAQADQGGVGTFHPGDANIVSTLLSGDTFVLVHTTNVTTAPFGEIRGQVQVVPAPAPLFALLALAPLLLAARRRA